MATHEADLDKLEYGPTPPGAQYEHTDIEPSIASQFAIWLTVSMLISAGIVYGTFWFFEGREEAQSRAEAMYPLAAGQTREPPTPRLQTQPFKDVYLLRQGEAEKLTTYGWIDKEQGLVRLPIERAMELTLQRGLPTRPGAGAPSAGMIVQDSSAGRTAAPR
jgi:hypothetical protein